MPKSGVPLQLDLAAGDLKRGFGAFVVEGDGAGLGVDMLHRHVEHAAALGRNRQERAVCRLALFAQRRQHHRHDLVVALGGAQQHRVELAGLVIIGRTGELVLEAEGVEEAAEHGVVVVAEAGVVAAERIGHRRERLVQVRFEEGAVRHVVGDLAHAVHVVGEAQQLRLDLAFGQYMEGVAYHGGARHFTEGADMRQAGWAVAGLEQDDLGKFFAFVALDDLFGLFERPGFAFSRCREKFGVEIDGV